MHCLWHCQCCPSFHIGLSWAPINAWWQPHKLSCHCTEVRESMVQGATHEDRSLQHKSKNDWPFLSVSYLLSMELRAFHTLSCSILSTTQWNAGYFYPCFTNGGVKAQGLSDLPNVTQWISDRVWIWTQTYPVLSRTQIEGVSNPEWSSLGCDFQGWFHWQD